MTYATSLYFILKDSSGLEYIQSTILKTDIHRQSPFLFASFSMEEHKNISRTAKGKVIISKVQYQKGSQSLEDKYRICGKIVKFMFTNTIFIQSSSLKKKKHSVGLQNLNVAAQWRSG